MPDSTPASPAAETPAAAPAPVDIITPQDATAELIARKLNPEQASKFRASRAAKKAKQAAAAPTPAPAPASSAPETPAAAAPAAPEAAAAESAPAPTETVSFGDDTETPAAVTEAEPAVVELTEAELAALSDKARKQYLEASKEAAKVRKRAQEAEAKAKDLEAAKADLEKRLGDLQRETEETGTRAVGLAGNAFAAFRDPKEVAEWGTNAQEAVAVLRAHERQIKAGRASAEDSVLHILPDGTEIPLTVAKLKAFETRVSHAQAWFEHDAQITRNTEAAQKLAQKHESLKGYKEAREAYLKDANIAARLPELLSKAALYDLLQSRKATITFPDAAAGAKSPASSRTEESAPVQRKTPPSETPASTPRLASVTSEGSDVQGRKSHFMQMAKTAKTEADRQKYLKEAIKAGASRYAATPRR